MSADSEYEIKFHLYDGNEQDIDVLFKRYKKLRDVKKAEEGVMAKVITHFYNGLISLVEGDTYFWQKKYREAFLAYQEASRLFNNFTISRTVKVKLDQFVHRLDKRAIGLKKLCEGLLVSKHELQDNLFVESMNEFNEEIAIANEMGDQMSSYAAYARASFVSSQLLYYRSKHLQDENSGLAKKNVLESRFALRQAAFIDKRYRTYLDEITEQLDTLTRKRLLAKGEEFADQATIAMESSNFEDAILGFNKASLFYKRASVIASDGSSRRMLLSFATLYEASIKEAKATEAQKEINLEEASEKFMEAMKLVDKAIALLGHFGTDALINAFKCQRDYYNGMLTLNKATKEFDHDNFDEAKTMFEEAKDIFESAINLADKVDNQSISNISKEAVSEIASYITMCENLA
ncbi:MAG: hypothetical protein INQ03_11970 [Candidatus Heimdallarchaeota archaeon]|nr:hypothetical protein [Candidatus Heimdallarchaeota archaeon]